MLVLGAGLQGSACAYDLLQNRGVDAVRLADLHIDHLASFLAPHAGPRLLPTPLDVRDEAAVRALMRECDAVMSALPYYFNFDMARLAVDSGVPFTDLGGNTEIVGQQRSLDAPARAKKISVVPDTGVAPGMVNILAQHGIDQLDDVQSVRIYVGGLPQHPEPPLNYQIVYSIEGVLDYYTTLSWIIRDGRRTQVKALSEVEPVDFPAPVGRLEAFHTAGGLSTMAFRYEGKIPEMEYKTLRYPGHAKAMETIRDLGLLELEPVEVKGHRVVPRDVFIALASPRLTKPTGRDLVALRIVVRGKKKGADKTITYEVIDRYDEQHGISAMMRTTGYSLAITGMMQARGEVEPGVHTPDEGIPAERYMTELKKRGIDVRVR